MCLESEIKDIKGLCSDRGTEIALMNNKLNQHDKKLNRILEKLDNFDRKYSGKWVEKAMIAFITILCMSALYLILDSSGLPR